MPNDILDSKPIIPIRRLYNSVIEILIIILSLIAWGLLFRAVWMNNNTYTVTEFCFCVAMGSILYGSTLFHIVIWIRVSILYDKNNNLDLISNFEGNQYENLIYIINGFLIVIPIVFFLAPYIDPFHPKFQEQFYIHLLYTVLLAIINLTYFYHIKKTVKNIYKRH
jgi:hypothetical protein